MDKKLVSKECVNFVKSFEGFSSKPYYDEVGVLTLGYGMTGDEIKGLSSVTEEQASSMLEDWLNKKYASVLKSDLDNRGITLTQNQFDALTSMAYNVGTSGVLGSTLYRNICNGVRDVAIITANFVAWSKAGGKTLAGLVRRRQDEAKMFFGAGNTVVVSGDTLISETKNKTLKEQISSLQYHMNVDYNAKLKHTDGNIYQETLDNLKSIGNIIKKGHKSHIVLWLQQKLEMWGYLKKGSYTEMLYDEPTFQAVTELQKNWERPTDGVLRMETWSIFLNN